MSIATLKALVTLAEPVESITTMEAASESRWLDAVAIAVERPNDALGCAYLLGYVVECRLKAALGRVNNVLPPADLYAAVVHPLAVQDRHNVEALLRECLARRTPRLPPLSLVRESAWHFHVAAIAGAHAVGYRYKSYAVAVPALNGLYSSVEWIVDNIAELWN